MKNKFPGNTKKYSPRKQNKGIPSIGYLAFTPRGFQRVKCVNIDGIAVYQGKIKLGPIEHFGMVERLCQQHNHSHFRPVSLDALNPIILTVINTTQPWPDRTVYYQIDENVIQPEKVIAGIQYWNDSGVITITERTNQTNYVNILMIEQVGSDGGSSNSVGMKGGEQTLELWGNVHEDVIIHEFGHIIGLFHEMQADNSESYLDINWANIEQHSRNQFKPEENQTYVGHYDYLSIMQYGRKFNAIDYNKDSMTPYDKNANINQFKLLTISDLNAVQAIYSGRIKRIKVEITTGTNGTDGHVYLGIGGREFRLDNPSHNDFEPTRTDIFNLGKKNNVKNPIENDPRTPALNIRQIMSFPCYIRLDSKDGWNLNTIKVEIRYLNNVAPMFYFSNSWLPEIYLDTTSTQIVQLLRDAPADFNVATQDNYLVSAISISTTTGDNGTNDDVYFGIGGREFRLQDPNSNFSRGETNTFLLTNTEETPKHNNLKSPQLYIYNLISFPCYIRKSGVDNWELESADVTVTYTAVDNPENPPTPPPIPVTYNLAAGGLILGDNSGKSVSLKYSNRKVGKKGSRGINKIRVSIDTGDNPTNDDVYLGIAGREFKLKKSGHQFNSNSHRNIFIFGSNESNVSHPLKNDPTNPQLNRLDLLTYDVYIRKEGTDTWTLKSATITVFINDSVNTVVFNSYLLDLELGPKSGKIANMVRAM